jgi:hypothetical protein
MCDACSKKWYSSDRIFNCLHLHSGQKLATPVQLFCSSKFNDFRNDNVRKSGRFSKIFWHTEMYNTSQKSTEKSSFNFEIIFEVFFIKKQKIHFFVFQ